MIDAEKCDVYNTIYRLFKFIGEYSSVIKWGKKVFKLVVIVQIVFYRSLYESK